MEKANKERGKGEEVSRCSLADKVREYVKGREHVKEHEGERVREHEGESYDGVAPGTAGALPHTESSLAWWTSDYDYKQILLH